MKNLYYQKTSSVCKCIYKYYITVQKYADKTILCNSKKRIHEDIENTRQAQLKIY